MLRQSPATRSCGRSRRLNGSGNPTLQRICACPPVPSQLVFPSWKTGRVLSGWKTYLRDLRRTSGVDFTLHDLRRTMRSGLSALGVDKDVAELAIGHQREELIRLYDKSERWP